VSSVGRWPTLREGKNLREMETTAADKAAVNPAAEDRPTDFDIATARRVLQTKANGVLALADHLGEDFIEAVKILVRVTGRVVVTGMGKSGHVARKIAATMASTGTPALFVHPGEASHGDLGMITKADAVLALSTSGETSKLSDVVAYTRRFAIPLIGITGRAESTLAKAADVTLVLPPVGEACPMGLAPTTSTMMMLALGDALALTLLERKGFTADDFHTFHPGGKLSKILIRVEDIMHGREELPLIPPETPMSEAILVMTEKRFGCAVITDGAGRLIGIITDGDLRRHMGRDLLETSASQVMTRNPKTIQPQALAGEALEVMNSCAITNLFVVTDDRPVGIVHVHDCLRAGVM